MKKITIASQEWSSDRAMYWPNRPIFTYKLQDFFKFGAYRIGSLKMMEEFSPIVIFFKSIFNLPTLKNSKRSCTLQLHIYVTEWCKTIRSQLKYFSIKSHFLGVTMFPQLYNKVLYVPKFLVVLLRWVCDLSKIRRDSNDWVFSMVAAMIAAEISWSSLCVCVLLLL